MSLADRVRAFLGPIQEKASAVAPLFARLGLMTPRWMPDNLESYSRNGFGKNAIVYKCVSILGRSMASVPWQLMSGSGKTAVEVEDDQHPLLMLLRRPNPTQGGASFFEAVLAYYLLHGNAFVEGVSANDSGAPLELWCHRPDRMKIIPDAVVGNMVGQFEYSYSGGKKLWRMDPIRGIGPVLHWKTFNPVDDWYGQPVMKAAAAVVDQHNSASEWNQSMLRNAAVPPGGFKYAPEGALGAKLTEQQRKQLEKDMEEKMQGPLNARRPLMLDGGLEWQEMGLSPVDMDWLEGRKAAAIDICAVFGVPPQVYGVPDAQTFANYEQARLAMYEESIIPLHDSLCDELNHWLVPSFGDKLTLRADWDQVDALQPKRTMVWTRVQTSDWLTINEKREATGYDVLDDDMADQVLVDAGKVPLSASGDAASTDGAPATPALDENGNPLPVDPNAPPNPDAPAPPIDGSGNLAPADAVQSAGLNGTQIASLQTLLDDVASGHFSPEAAVIMILLAFPTFDPARVQEMVDAQDTFEPEPPPVPTGPDGQPLQPPGAAGPAAPGKPGQAVAAPNKLPKKPAALPPKKSDEVEAFTKELISQGFKDDSARSFAQLAYGDDA